MLKKAVFWGLFLAMTLLSAELFLRLTGSMKTYTEKTGGYYYSYYGQVYPTWYLTRKPNTVLEVKQTEFSNSFPINSIGLKEKEIPSFANDSTKRLFVLGDSFVEGDGVDYYHSMPRYLEHLLDSSKMGFEVYSAGISGSDPFYCYTLLRDKLLPLHPTHVLFCFNNSDINDFIYRGGMERFYADGTTHNRPGPFLERMYAYSHLVRFVVRQMGYNELFMSKAQETKADSMAVAAIYQCLKQAKQLCDAHNIKFAAVLQPLPNTIANNYENDPIAPIATQYPADSINLINLYPSFASVLNQENYRNFSWEINGHYNEKGYQVFANQLYKDLNTYHPEFW